MPICTRAMAKARGTSESDLPSNEDANKALNKALSRNRPKVEGKSRPKIRVTTKEEKGKEGRERNREVESADLLPSVPGGRNLRPRGEGKKVERVFPFGESITTKPLVLASNCRIVGKHALKSCESLPLVKTVLERHKSKTEDLGKKMRAIREKMKEKENIPTEAEDCVADPDSESRIGAVTDVQSLTSSKTGEATSADVEDAPATPVMKRGQQLNLLKDCKVAITPFEQKVKKLFPGANLNNLRAGSTFRVSKSPKPSSSASTTSLKSASPLISQSKTRSSSVSSLNQKSKEKPIPEPLQKKKQNSDSDTRKHKDRKSKPLKRPSNRSSKVQHLSDSNLNNLNKEDGELNKSLELFEDVFEASPAGQEAPTSRNQKRTRDMVEDVVPVPNEDEEKRKRNGSVDLFEEDNDTPKNQKPLDKKLNMNITFDFKSIAEQEEILPPNKKLILDPTGSVQLTKARVMNETLAPASKTQAESSKPKPLLNSTFDVDDLNSPAAKKTNIGPSPVHPSPVKTLDKTVPVLDPQFVKAPQAKKLDFEECSGNGNFDATVCVSEPKFSGKHVPSIFQDGNSSKHQLSVLEVVEEEEDADSPMFSPLSVPPCSVQKKLELERSNKKEDKLSSSSSSSSSSFKSAQSSISSLASSKKGPPPVGPKTLDIYKKKAEDAARLKEENLKKKQEIQKKKNEEWKLKADKIKLEQEKEKFNAVKKIAQLGIPGSAGVIGGGGGPPKFLKPQPAILQKPPKHPGPAVSSQNYLSSHKLDINPLYKASGPMKAYVKQPPKPLTSNPASYAGLKTPVKSSTSTTVAEGGFKTPGSSASLDVTIEDPSAGPNSYDITMYEDLDEEGKHREHKHVPDWAKNKDEIMIMLFKQLECRAVPGVGFPFPKVEKGYRLYDPRYQ